MRTRQTRALIFFAIAFCIMFSFAMAQEPTTEPESAQAAEGGVDTVAQIDNTAKTPSAPPPQDVAGVLLYDESMRPPPPAQLDDAAATEDAMTVAMNASHIWIFDIEIEGEPAGLPVPEEILPKTSAQHDTAVVVETANKILRFYADNGYPFVRLRAVISHDRNELLIVTLRFFITAGERVCNAPVILAGDGDSTQKKMFMRDVRIREGEMYSRADVDETLRRLNRRRYVKNAISGSAPIVIEDMPPCANGSQIAATTPIHITENRSTIIEGALAYGNEKFSGMVNLSLINLWRRGEQIDFSYTGTDNTQAFHFSGALPWAFSLPLELGVNFDAEIDEDAVPIDTTKAGYIAGGLWGAMELGADYRGGLALNFSQASPEIGDNYTYFGSDIFIELIEKPWERGVTAWEFAAKTGSGMANRADKSYNRTNAEFAAGVHQPVLGIHAIAARVQAMSLFTDEESLLSAEMYRLGGHGSLRGYSENEFAFRAATYAQFEFLRYIDRYGAAYIFADAGVGFKEKDFKGEEELAGFGLGIRFPTRLGTVTVEWGTNIDDDIAKGGRVHVGIRRVQ